MSFLHGKRLRTSKPRDAPERKKSIETSVAGPIKRENNEWTRRKDVITRKQSSEISFESRQEKKRGRLQNNAQFSISVKKKQTSRKCPYSS